MRRRFLLLLPTLLVIGFAHPAAAQTLGTLQKWCESGNTFANVSGITSVTPMQGSYPKCQVSVVLTGTITPATIYSSITFTPLANPFCANADGSFLLYAAISAQYDVTISNSPSCNPAASGFAQLPAPFTFFAAAVSGSGGGGTTVTGTVNQIVVNAGQVSLSPSIVFPGTVSGAVGNFATLAGTFPVNGTTSNLVVGDTITNPCCSLPEGSLWMLDGSLHGAPHLTGYDGSGYFTLLSNNDSACDFAAGCTGTGNQVALQNTPHFTTPDVDNATGISISLASTTGDNMDLQQGTVTPFCQATPTSGHIKTCYGSDARFQISEGDGSAFHDFTQTIASGSTAMTTALIAGGACGTAVTATATGTLSTDSLSLAGNAVITAANGGLLILNWWVATDQVGFKYCNPGAGNVTPSAATKNWTVTR